MQIETPRESHLFIFLRTAMSLLIIAENLRSSLVSFLLHLNNEFKRTESTIRTHSCGDASEFDLSQIAQTVY